LSFALWLRWTWRGIWQFQKIVEDRDADRKKIRGKPRFWDEVKMETTHWLTLAALMGGLVAFLGGLVQYRRAQRWKRAEFVASEIKEFKADPMVRNALLLLDWNERAVELCPQEADPEKRCVRIEDRAIAKALVPHVTRSDFTPLEIALRDTFDRFFDRLERFEYFLEAGLVSKQEFAPYLRYWLEILGNENSGRKSPEVVRAIWVYIDFYYCEVISLLRRFGYRVRPKGRG
jgi:hypothetical protein